MSLTAVGALCSIYMICYSHQNVFLLPVDSTWYLYHGTAHCFLGYLTTRIFLFLRPPLPTSYSVGPSHEYREDKVSSHSSTTLLTSYVCAGTFFYNFNITGWRHTGRLKSVFNIIEGLNLTPSTYAVLWEQPSNRAIRTAYQDEKIFIMEYFLVSVSGS